MKKVELNSNTAILDLDLRELAAFADCMSRALGDETRVRVEVEHEDYADLLRSRNGVEATLAALAEKNVQDFNKRVQEVKQAK